MLPYSQHNERSILSNQTYQMPLCFLNKNFQWVFLRYRDHKGIDRDLIGNIHEIHDTAYRLTFWTTRSLARLPAAVRCSKNIKDMAYESKDIESEMNARRIFQTDEYFIRLWNAESQAGQPLLVGKTLEGFPTTGSLNE